MSQKVIYILFTGSSKKRQNFKNKVQFSGYQNLRVIGLLYMRLYYSSWLHTLVKVHWIEVSFFLILPYSFCFLISLLFYFTILYFKLVNFLIYKLCLLKALKIKTKYLPKNINLQKHFFFLLFNNSILADIFTRTTSHSKH